jgi:hypothetical protein
MNSPKHDTRGTANSFTYELPYDNDLDQDELNRRLRKPGEPGYCPPAKKAETANSQKDGLQGGSANESRKS